MGQMTWTERRYEQCLHISSFGVKGEGCHVTVYASVCLDRGAEFVSTVPENRRSQPKSTPGHSRLAFRLHQTLTWATEPRFYLNDSTFLRYLEPQVQYGVLHRNTKFAFQEIQARVPGIPVLVYDAGRANLISIPVSMYKMRIRVVSTSQGYFKDLM